MSRRGVVVVHLAPAACRAPMHIGNLNPSRDRQMVCRGIAISTSSEPIPTIPVRGREVTVIEIEALASAAKREYQVE